ncbi:aminoglycoside phosphotransferase family protein [Aliikangiella sp. G2MR2-5]|uniref:aminoglycoside phosphotransferase family protein n=1 Tax=Aliikangiella sp. G2MR2-5 TaxID=2788943 RepID=UPI0018ABF205|nr:aminoglycoside phosphotransferase family protein [Aliikangiella sp. G2MR2-5]
MSDILSDDWESLKTSFQLETSLADVEPLGQGHINDTFLVSEGDSSWVLQHINSQVFPNPQLVQQNFDKVSEHLSVSDYPLERLSIRKTRNGHSLALNHGRSWRLMKYIQGCKTLEIARHAQDAFNCARAVGLFDRALSTLPASSIRPVIEGFHDLQLRLNQFNLSLLKNHENRVARCAQELEVVKQFSNLANWIPKAKANQLIQEKITHNDTKISNILVSEHTGIVKAVIDWDTIMPGYYLFDYGDMIRSFAPVGGEDMPEYCELRWDVVQAVTEGYLSGNGDNLSRFEKENLLIGAQIMIFMVGVRFLTDYFNGDIYFKTRQEDQNLLRAQTQFALLTQLHREHDNWQKVLGLKSVKSA